MTAVLYQGYCTSSRNKRQVFSAEGLVVLLCEMVYVCAVLRGALMLSSLLSSKSQLLFIFANF